MSIKLKALGLGLIAALAVGAFGVVNAAADPEGDTGGHFVSDAPSGKTIIEGTEIDKGDELHFLIHDVEGEIGCDIDEYTGTMGTNTETELTITPKWGTCYTTDVDDPQNPIIIDVNTCDFNFTVNTEPEVKHSTVHVKCTKEGDAIEITHPNCTIKIPEQTVSGVTYETIVIEEKHAITLNSTVGPTATDPKNEVEGDGITTHFESFGCILVFGTNHEGEMKGGAIVHGKDHITKNRVNITAT